MTQTERIEHYERVLDAVTAAEEKLERALEDFAAAGPLLRELESYYGSEEWRKDFEDDEKGLLPKDLKRGVASAAEMPSSQSPSKLSILPSSQSAVSFGSIGRRAVCGMPSCFASSSTWLAPKISCFPPQSGH